MSPAPIPISVRFISDIACPFCYLGLKQLMLASEQKNIPVNVHYHAYLLNPGMPEDGFPRRQYFKERFGVAEIESSPMTQRLVKMGSEIGIKFQLHKPDVMSNTQRAQALMIKAKRELGVEQQLKLLNLFFQSYFEQGLDIGDVSVYKKLASEVGLSIQDNHFDTDEGRNDLRTVRDQDREAKSKYNVTGVPTFVFEERYAISGAQGVESISAILERVQTKL